MRKNISLLPQSPNDEDIIEITIRYEDGNEIGLYISEGQAVKLFLTLSELSLVKTH